MRRWRVRRCQLVAGWLGRVHGMQCGMNAMHRGWAARVARSILSPQAQLQNTATFM
jgi:hypothetical protein